VKTSYQHYDVIIIGGGAAGLLCAMTAAKRGRSVLVLEKSNKIGKKILMSGGGKCNFTNEHVSPGNFLSANTHFCKSALNRYTPSDFIKMVESHGVGYEVRKHHQLFCVNTSKDILKMLINECESSDVGIRTHSTITSIKYSDDAVKGYRLTGVDESGYGLSDICYSAESLVIATGALSIPSLGGSGFGYIVAQQFDIPVTELRAGLVPFRFSDYMKPICERLSGLSLPVEISCNRVVFKEYILFTHRGLSGPSILQISSYWNPGETITVNLLPETNMSKELVSIKKNQGNSLLRSYLSRYMPKALVLELEKLLWSDMAELPIQEWPNKKLEGIGAILNNWVLKPSGTEGYRTAEVTLGGVDTDHVSSKTMEVNGQDGLYFIGEVLDVSGHLGGFNFQWAWASGYVAGLYV
jgi:predicted Rossmann fold flavoprotein